MRAARLLASLVILATLQGVANAQTGCVRLSWNTCDPWRNQSCWQGPGQYRLVVSATGIGTPNVGTDLNIRIQAQLSCPGDHFEDSWRFDDAGCQTGGRLSINSDALDPSCPALKGSNVWSITNYSYDANGQAADLRLAILYDSVTPNPATRYTLWAINFDHTHSVEGPSPADHSLCGGIEQTVRFLFSHAILLATSGQPLNIAGCDVPIPGTGAAAHWGPFIVCGPSSTDDDVPRGLDDCAPVPAHASTWGRVRATYR